ncbi:hypothetical protein BHE74_00025985, partial [Ensete ventricosum]
KAMTRDESKENEEDADDVYLCWHRYRCKCSATKRSLAICIGVNADIDVERPFCCSVRRSTSALMLMRCRVVKGSVNIYICATQMQSDVQSGIRFVRHLHRLNIDADTNVERPFRRPTSASALALN